LLLFWLLLGAGAAQAAQALDLDSLLDAVAEGAVRDEALEAERLREFSRRKAEQQSLLADMQAKRRSLEARSESGEAQFEENELLLGELETRLKDRMGSLKELFGVLQQVAGDAQAQFGISLTQLEHPDRTEFLLDFAARMGQANRLPAISEIERLWFELHREMTESARVGRTEAVLVTREGAEQRRAVTRLGLFNVVADGRYLEFVPETGRLVEYSRQPAARYLAGIEALAAGREGVVPVAVDPTRGQLLDILTQAPLLHERVAQGGQIGFAIIALGVFGVLFALARLGLLAWQSRRVHRQLARLDAPAPDNALGRILLAVRDRRDADVDTLELLLGEAVLKETPRINAYIPLLKIIAAVAPLMGLLGTVTGMIVTFQAITLFGAGDPRLMAGGISQALVTTVLGLCVAVPMLLLHNLVQMRARALTELLQHKAVALVARRAEHEALSPAMAPQADGAAVSG